MALSSVELWQRISSAGLAAPMICRSWAAEALQGLQPTDATDANKILDQLVRLGRLTDYQADLIAGRRQGDFKKGVWTLLRPVSVPLWEGWFEATKSPNEPATWLRWLSSDGLAELQSAAPSLPRGLRLAQVKGTNLQGVQVPELIDKQLQLQVHPVQGIPLSMAYQQDASLVTKSAEIIRRVAEALKPLHAVGLAHGRVLPDRVYLHAEANKEISVTLARDPICCHTASLDTNAIGVIQSGLNGLYPAQFMAPEFLAPGQLPTPSSDIYSLGCLWWWLVTGKPLVVGSTPDKQLARQAEASIALPKECPLPAPFIRCLQHCLAKNLPARFATAEQLCQALEAASLAVAKGPVPKQAIAAKQAETKPALQPTKSIAAPEPEQATAPKSEKKQSETVVAQVAQPVAQPVAQAVAQAVAQNASAKKSAATTGLKAQVQPYVQPQAQPQLESVFDKSLPTAEPAIQAKVRPAANPKTDTNANRPDPIESQVSGKTQPTMQAAGAGVQTGETTTSENVISQTAEPGPSEPAAPELIAPVPNATQFEPVKAGTIGAKSTKPALGKAIANKPGVRKKAKRKPANKWALPVIGGLGCVCALLGILIFSGVLKPSGRKPANKPVEVAGGASNNDVENLDTKTTTKAPAQDPRLEVYQIVKTGKDLLWVPPAAPKPIALDLLPPGGQIFITLRPQQLMASPTGKSLLASYDEDLGAYLDQIGKRSGVTFDSIERVTIAVYAENEVPMTCMRIQLAKPLALSSLKANWGSVADEKVDTVTLLSSAAGESYFVAQQPLSDAQSVSEFSLGPTALMKEAAELQGEAGPLVSQLGKLWQASDADADLSILLTSSFLFSEGKSILGNMPKRLGGRLREVLEVDSRAALIQTRLEPAWYVEVQLVGPSDREAPRLSESLRQRITGASTAIEEWFVSEQPHPYWRSLAIRYPQMLRTLADQTRFGVEGGAAIANAYLPSEAATNILLSTWIAAQEGATLVSDAPAETVATTPDTKPLTLDEYLARKIKLSFDQEPIETALRLVGDEANANLPAGTPQLRFALDGGAFERAGITRNQQLRDFKHLDLPMRDALTAIAKRGNPVTTVKDTHEEDQRLIWVVRDDPENAGKQMISLTTRAEAAAKNISLPTEFAPVK